MTICEHCKYPHDGESCPNPACLVNVGAEVWEARRAKREEEAREREFRLRMWSKSLGENKT